MRHLIIKSALLARATVVALGWGSPIAGQVNVPEGFELVEFGVSDLLTSFPSMNECGQVVYSKSSPSRRIPGEVFLYDNGRIIQITFDNHHDNAPDINNAGTMVWGRGPNNSGVRQVILYENGVETIIDDADLYSGGSSINELGHVMWHRYSQLSCPIRSDIFLWNGGRIRQIDEDDDFNDQCWRGLNDVGDFVWTHFKECVDPWVSTLLHRRSRRTEELPTASTQSQLPVINNQRQAVWGAPLGLEFWENGRTEFLIEWGSVPAINDHADLYFARWDNERREHEPWVSYKVGNDRSWHRLVVDTRNFSRGDINDWGEAVTKWKDDFGIDRGGVLLLRRARSGDAEFDGSIDLTDYGRLAECLTGPDWDELVQHGPDETLCECRFLDLDYDGDVDLGDFARFQNAYMSD